MSSFNDLPVLFRRDGALGFEFNFRPEALWDDRPQKPVHGEAEIMEFAQVNIGADRTDFECLQNLFGGRLTNEQVTNGVESLVFGGGRPAVAGGTLLGVNNRIE